MRKRLLQVFAIGLAVVMLLLTGCGALKSTKNETAAVAPAGAKDYGGISGGTKPNADLAYTNGSNVNVSFSESVTASSNVKATSEDALQSANVDKKIIKSANASLEVANADQALETISKWLEGGIGYEFNKSSVMRGQYKQINVVFKLKPEKLSEFLLFLESVGRVTNMNSNSNDITDQYYDTSARLDNLRKGRDQLLEIMKRAVTIEDTLRVQNELNRITGEIEVQQGRLNMWNKLVDESSVNLTIVEEADPMKVNKDISWRFSSVGDILKFMKNGFILTTNTILNGLVWVVVIIVSASPILVIGAVIFIYIKKRKNKRDQGPKVN